MTAAQGDITALQTDVQVAEPLGITGLAGGHWHVNSPGANQIQLTTDGDGCDGLIHAMVGDGLGLGRKLAFSGAMTGNLAASGLNGLDVGVKAANKIYVWRIVTNAARTLKGLLATLSGTAPTLPVGYVLATDVVAISVTDGAGNQYDCCHSRGGRNCWEFDVSGLGGIPLLSNGVAVAYTAIGQIRALSTVFPSERREGEIQLYYEASQQAASSLTVGVYNLDSAVYCLRGRQIGLGSTPGERQYDSGNWLALVDGATIDTSLWYIWSGAPTGGLSLWLDKIWI
jgi:hypothetical protein